MSRLSTWQQATRKRFFLRHPWRSLSAVVCAMVVGATLVTVAETLRTARIVGHVTGEGRVPLNGARVTLLPVDDKPALTQISDLDGAFTFSEVPAGRYRVDLSYQELHATSNAPLQFEAGESYTLDMPMVPPHDESDEEDADTPSPSAERRPPNGTSQQTGF